MSFLPRIDHHYDLWTKLTNKFVELGVNSEEVQDFLEETIENYIRLHKKSVQTDIDNALDIIAMYDKKRSKT